MNETCEMCDYFMGTCKHCFLFKEKPMKECFRFKIDPEKYYNKHMEDLTKAIEPYRKGENQ
jgi:hypothetical protein